MKIRILKITLLCFITLTPSLLNAQLNNDGVSIFQESQDTYNALEDMTADYTLSIVEHAMNINYTRKGTLKTKGANAYVSFPESEEETFCNGNDVWAINHRDLSAYKSKYNALLNPGPIMVYALYTDDVRIASIANIDGLEVVLLYDFPEDSDLHKVQVKINENLLIEEVLIHLKSEVKIERLMKEIKTNTGLRDDIFKMNKYGLKWDAEEYEFIDLSDEDY